MSATCRVRVLFCWSVPSGYMAACWRELLARPEVELQVVAFQPTARAQFAANEFSGLPIEWASGVAKDDRQLLLQKARHFVPHLIVVSGWFYGPYREMLRGRPSARIVMAMDTPWRCTGRQILGVLPLRWALRGVSAVWVPGMRAKQYAGKLGFGEGRVFDGLYGVNHRAFSRVRLVRPGAAGRHAFLFVGRYAPEKGIETLVKAYQEYRRQAADPWPLVCCGDGPLRWVLSGVDGIVDRGFVQPSDLPRVFAEASVFVICSGFDPWPLVLVEASMAGLPSIVSDACGSSDEVVEDGVSGWIVGSGGAKSIAEAMAVAQSCEARLSGMGERAHELARAYGADVWVERCLRMVRAVMAW